MFADNSIEKISEKQALCALQGDFNLKIPYIFLPIVFKSIPIAIFSQIKYTFALSGNRCGHDPQNPNVITYPNSKGRPKNLRWLIERVGKYARGSNKYMQGLKTRNKVKKSGVNRINRSDGRESIANLCEIILHNLELDTMTVCKDDIVYNHPTMEELTNKGDLLSLTRARRALKALADISFITITRQFEKSKNRFYGLASVIKVNPEFYIALGLTKQQYKESRNIKRKIIEKRQKYHQKITKKQFRARRLDAFLPNRDVIFKKSDKGGKTFEVFDHAEVEAMRKELIMFCTGHSPYVDRKLIESVAYKYTPKQLIAQLENYRKLKSHDPPS